MKRTASIIQIKFIGTSLLQKVIIFFLLTCSCVHKIHLYQNYGKHLRMLRIG